MTAFYPVCRGNAELLRKPLVALLASTRVPPDLWLPTLDLVCEIARSGTPLVGGFHSPLERDCYEVALRSGGYLVRISAAQLTGRALSEAERLAIDQERLLILGPDEGVRRTTARAAEIRNQQVLDSASKLFIPAAPPASRTYRAAAAAVATRLPTYCFEHRRNIDLQILGAHASDPGDPEELARELSGSSLKSGAMDLDLY